jgi:hypothetical protein
VPLLAAVSPVLLLLMEYFETLHLHASTRELDVLVVGKQQDQQQLGALLPPWQQASQGAPACLPARRAAATGGRPAAGLCMPPLKGRG